MDIEAIIHGDRPLPARFHRLLTARRTLRTHYRNVIVTGVIVESMMPAKGELSFGCTCPTTMIAALTPVRLRWLGDDPMVLTAGVVKR